MDKKIVLISGASSGLGKSMGLFLTQNHFQVIGTSRNPEAQTHSPYPFVKLDLLDNTSIENCIKKVIGKCGKIDVLINNAGVSIIGPTEEIQQDAIEEHFKTNVFGQMKLINTVSPYMRKQNGGLIINVTSIAGYSGLPFRGVYSAGKSAMLRLTESYSMELKPYNINICSLSPGYYATEIGEKRYYAPLRKNSPYFKIYEHILNPINDYVEEGRDPIEVAKLVYKIIHQKKPKLHYKVGAFLQKFSTFLKFLLPQRWFEKMMMNHYDI